MGFKKRDKTDADVDMGAFSDIAFLLIIFFILTTTFVKVAGNNIDIPSGQVSDNQKEKKQLTINLTQEGKIEFGEKQKSMSIEQLRDELAKQKFPDKDEDDRMVILDSHDQTNYETYFQVVMAITNAGGVLALVDEKGDKEKK